jgi:hypothetical protein
LFALGMINYLRMPFFKFPWETFKNLKEVMGADLVPFYTSMLLGSFFVLGLFLIQKSLYHIIKIGYFNERSALLLRKSGLVFIISSVLDSLRIAFNNSDFDQKSNNIAVTIFILMVGIGVLLLSDVVKKGILIKNENDLTI